MNDVEAIYRELSRKYSGRRTIKKTEAAEEFGMTVPTFTKKVKRKEIKLDLPVAKRGEKTYISIRKIAEAIALF